MPRKRKSIKVLSPPHKGEVGKEVPVVCVKSDDPKVKGGCGKQVKVLVHDEPLPKGPISIKDIKTTPDKPVAICTCGHEMFTDFSKFRVGISARGPGFHSTKFGMRRKAEMVKRSERLAKTQWDNHQPIASGEGMRARNYTKDGPLDPNSKRFGKKKSKPIYSIGSGSKKK